MLITFNLRNRLEIKKIKYHVFNRPDKLQGPWKKQDDLK